MSKAHPVLLHTKDAPTPNGHYSQGVAFGQFLFTSMQLPIDPADHERRVDSVEAQTVQVLNNLDAILNVGGSSLSHTLRVTLFVVDIEQWSAVNRAYTTRMGDHKPARGVVQVARLHKNFSVGAEAIGWIRGYVV